MSKNSVIKQQKTLKEIKKKKANSTYVRCSSCGETKALHYFYKSWNDVNKGGGIIPYCKSCLKSMSTNKFGDFEEEKAINVLRMIDKPYISILWWEAIETCSDFILGKYIAKLNLSNNHKYKGWADGELAEKPKVEKPPIESNNNEIENDEEEKEEEKKESEAIIADMDSFDLTPEIIELFGSGYTKEEYFYMWNKYAFLRENYTEQTNMHTEALITYIRYKVKEEMAIAKGKPHDAKTWGELAMKQADKAKINPYQFSKADLQGGLSTIGEIAQAVEQNVDIIPVLPQFRYRPNDAVDFCIWNYINYARELEGKPLVEYKDVYGFYDAMRDEYIANTGDPYGIFDNDPTLENREKVKTFIQLPDEYYEEGEE